MVVTDVNRVVARSLSYVYSSSCSLLVCPLYTQGVLVEFRCCDETITKSNWRGECFILNLQVTMHH